MNEIDCLFFCVHKTVAIQACFIKGIKMKNKISLCVVSLIMTAGMQASCYDPEYNREFVLLSQTPPKSEIIHRTSDMQLVKKTGESCWYVRPDSFLSRGIIGSIGWRAGDSGDQCGERHTVYDFEKYGESFLGSKGLVLIVRLNNKKDDLEWPAFAQKYHITNPDSRTLHLCYGIAHFPEVVALPSKEQRSAYVLEQMARKMIENPCGVNVVNGALSEDFIFGTEEQARNALFALARKIELDRAKQ